MNNQRNHHTRDLVGLTLAAVLFIGVALMPGSARLASAQTRATGWSYTGNLKDRATGTWSDTGFEMLSERIAILNIRIAFGVNSDPTGLAVLPPPKIRLRIPKRLTATFEDLKGKVGALAR